VRSYKEQNWNWPDGRLKSYLPDLTGASRIADTVLVSPSTRTPTCKSEVVDNIGLQSHGSAARLFRSMALSQQSTTGQLCRASQFMNAQDTEVTWVTNPL